MKKNKPLNKLLITAAACLVFGINAMAQINDAYARIEESGQSFNCSFIVELSDTVNTSEIEVALGTTDGATDVVLKNFTFDSSPPAGCTYARTGLDSIALCGCSCRAKHILCPCKG